MDPLFFYNLLKRIALLLPLFSIIPIIIGVILSKKNAQIDIFTYRVKLFRFGLSILGLSLIAYGILVLLPYTAQNDVIAKWCTIIIPMILYGFFANSCAKRFVGMGRSRFYALLLIIPLVNLCVCYFLATSYTTKRVAEKRL